MTNLRYGPCRNCGKAVLFVVVSNQEGRRPKKMPVDPRPSPGGNVAVHQDATGRLVGRVLGKHLPPLQGWERLYMSHFASCVPLPEPVPGELPPGVVALKEWKAANTRKAADDRRRRTRPRQPDITGYVIRPGGPGK